MAQDIDKLIAELTLDEKARLTAGEDLWSTVAIERLGIPKVGLTDGPNGARGTTLPGQAAVPSVCIPCGSALGATWNPPLVEELGALLGGEARAKGCRVLLAPTVNIHRSPLAGRNFECYSEDPLLSGRLAAAYVRGVQSRGVATTVKHFAGNDAEFQRFSMNSVIDERTLREIYLVPFELAVREGGTLGIMTGYNQLNGTYCAEHVWLLAEILRGEWGFEGFVVSDWYAVGSTIGSAEAGLDLQMPGPERFFGPPLAEAVGIGALDEAALDGQVRRLLTVFDRLGAFDDGDGAAGAEGHELRPEQQELARQAAAEAAVLLANRGGLLPLDPARIRSLAVVGPNANRAQIMGGGSASLLPHYRITPLEAITSRFGPEVDVRYEPGCDTDPTFPPLEAPFSIELFAGTALSGEVAGQAERNSGNVLFFGDPAPDVPASDFSFRATAQYSVAQTGLHRFNLVQSGRARLLIDGRVVLDGTSAPPPPGHELWGMGSQAVWANLPLTAGQTYEVVVEYSSRSSAGVKGVKVGCRPSPPADLIDRAVVAASAADAAIVVVGTTDEWESEGRDRSTIDLPGDQDALVGRVLAANPNTVVVINTGAPVSMPWAGDAPAIVQMWFGGQEMADALAGVLAGDLEPAGRLPTTFPRRIEDNPSFGNFPGENGELRYGEGLLVGYRWYDARGVQPLFPFGHGMSYTTFDVGEPQLSARRFSPGDTLRLAIPVTNTGSRRGAEVIQCYVVPRHARLQRPVKELKGFAKVWLDPGESTTATIELSDRSFAYWDPGYPEWPELRERLAVSFPFPSYDNEPAEAAGWRIDPGSYELHLGRSAADVFAVIPVTAAGTA